jgi:hypothetical protein
LVGAIASVSIGGAAVTLQAQVLHLPPVYRRVLPAKTVIMRIRRPAQEDGGSPVSQQGQEGPGPDTLGRAKTGSSASGSLAPARGVATVQLSLDDGQFIVQLQARPIATIALGDRLLRDLVNQINADFRDELVATSDYPLYPVSLVGDLPAVSVAPGQTVELYADSDEPDLRIGFGAVLALAEPKADGAAGALLTAAGFQLDIVGSHQIVGASARPRASLPVVFSQFRLGLNSDQQVQVDGDPEATAGTEIEHALAAADQLAVSGQLDFEWATWTPKMRLALSPSYAVNWTRLDAPPFPQVTVDGVSKPAEEVFSAEALARTKQAWANVKPLDEMGVLLTANFIHRDLPLYYAGLGVTRREILVQGVRFGRAKNEDGSAGEIDPESLVGLLDRRDVTVWRAVMGTRLAGVIDLRVDASGSIGVERVKPLLRVLIARGFPVGQ